MDSYDDYPAGEPIPEPAAMHGELIRFLTDNRDMRKTARSALKQGLWAGGGAMAGGLVMGPIGGLVGGITGSLVGFFKADDYDGVVLQLSKLNQHQRQFLLANVGQVLVAAGATTQQFATTENFRNALHSYAQQDSIRDGMWQACLNAMKS
mmetsp:Transcript_24533/g.40629  ORF Transcript_24533/g.40629 Transcript_24533/m.40629 type:complete len:151 (+) Transcript_24533:19-471(+)|eukprot:CAMPEP_0119016342 /NCGR_PEP_ID=MMETSP1176-20130426/12322_1 /TAXON_ID=265551 /ORGANISM="Synedropsis recta cf, Strain CCMP1620" /LENGTH=150 /DNA_ID=CAMNT_0006969711 /DNA_START=91 /DNA_END=543 /DNA_ORIENTATION=-